MKKNLLLLLTLSVEDSFALLFGSKVTIDKIILHGPEFILFVTVFRFDVVGMR